MLDWLFGKANKFTVASKGIQLYFRDDGNFGFRQLPIYDSFLVEGKKDPPTRAWQHLHELQFQFEGYKDIGAGAVSIGFDRETTYDPYEIADNKAKPTKGFGTATDLRKPWIARKATTKVYEYQKQKPKGMIMEKVSWALMIVLILMGVSFAITKIAG